MLGKLIVPYDTRRFDFAGATRAATGVPDLARWHRRYAPEGEEQPGFGDQASAMHRRLYDVEPFAALYREFVRTVITELVGEDVRYQHVPNWRIQLPGRHGVGSYHRDRSGGHNPCEITCWLPLTRTTPENSLWIESSEGAEDFRPHPMRYGQMLVFDSANLMHGNQRNASERTRVSFDFRVIPESLFHEGLATPHHTGIGGPIRWLRSREDGTA
ncbi:streptomycin biosynthesis protein StrG [Streptomyces sp. NEAU-sy36]|uniref:streptomycin biosynthesis protein StrG n=1 Tax=unclassified Streptomyces TaxID=2593676 RepID=UPI0015D6230D|nr:MULTISPECIES: streptomycin biosynthesis protein StrG [unclassified Streptomyces]QLJ03533.1 streptomycin biosynthesis protein StrG [Streptomyces sp. NEAU-sy36]